MYFSCFCKKRYQKKQTSVPLDRFVSCVQTLFFGGVCSPPTTGFPEKRLRFLGVPYNVVAPLLWFLNFALQNSPSEPRKGYIIKPEHALSPARSVTDLYCADGATKAPL